MQKENIKNITILNPALQEEILVISRDQLFSKIAMWQGLKCSDINQVLDIIAQNPIFIPRFQAETNKAYKQIIPYLIFTHNQKLFVMQRRSTASEQRLASQYSLGIGGHMRCEDMDNKHDIFAWAQREFHEEVEYSGSFDIATIGILNDETTDVGQVHLGIILLLKANSDQIRIKSEHKNGTLQSITECQKLYPMMENWSKICFDFLLQNQSKIKF